MKEFTPYFLKTFYKALLTPNGKNPVRDRADSLLKVFEILEKKQYPFYNIIETGCMRADHGELCFGDDGCATYILDKFITEMGGNFISVDINPDNVKYAQSKVSENTKVVCENSVSFLYKVSDAVKYDLIYLDSYDIEQANPGPSQLHHLKEMAALMKNIKQGTLIVVDDHDAFFTGGEIGKGNYVKSFMEDIGARIIHEGYQIVFEIQ